MAKKLFLLDQQLSHLTGVPTALKRHVLGSERSSDTSDALLDEQAAVTACLKQTVGDVEKIELDLVSAETFEDKLKVAARAGLHDVTFCTDQWPSEKTKYEFQTKFKSQPQKHSVHISGVKLLDEAYDILLHTSRAIRKYKQEIVYDWAGGVDETGNPLCDSEGQIRGKWIEEETHEDFKNV